MEILEVVVVGTVVVLAHMPVPLQLRKRSALGPLEAKLLLLLLRLQVLWNWLHHAHPHIGRGFIKLCVISNTVIGYLLQKNCFTCLWRRNDHTPVSFADRGEKIHYPRCILPGSSLKVQSFIRV